MVRSNRTNNNPLLLWKDDHDEPDRKKARLENDHDRDQTTTEKNVEAESGRPSRP